MAMMLTREQALGLLMRKQALSERLDDPFGVVDRLIAVQTQYAASLPQAVAVRLRRPSQGWIEQELRPRGRLVKTWTIRNTLHTMTEDGFALLLRAVGEPRLKKFLDYTMRRLGSAAELDRRHDAIVAALQDGPLTRQQLQERVEGLKDIPGAGWGMDLMGLAYEGIVSMTNHLGPTTFCLREPPAMPWSTAEARALLARRYLQGYGPATIQDFAYWSGLLVSSSRAAFESIAAELIEVEVDGRSRLFMLASDVDELDGEALPRVRLLPKFDAYVLGHKQKQLYLDPKRQKLVFRIAAQVEAVKLVNGEVKGTWRMQIKRDRLRLSVERWPQRTSKALLDAVEREAQHLAKAYGLTRAEIDYEDI
jgi:hypothetical protein